MFIVSKHSHTRQKIQQQKINEQSKSLIHNSTIHHHFRSTINYCNQLRVKQGFFDNPSSILTHKKGNLLVYYVYIHMYKQLFQFAQYYLDIRCEYIDKEHSSMLWTLYRKSSATLQNQADTIVCIQVSVERKKKHYAVAF